MSLSKRNIDHISSVSVPVLSDIRWVVFGLLFSFLVFGLAYLGFSRKPGQVALVLLGGGLLDIAYFRIFHRQWRFPLSALISMCSIAILLNYSYGYHYLFIPVFIAVSSKYLITYKGRHIFNPSMFAICICLLFSNEMITLAPSYQWYGTASTAWMMGFYIVTASLLFFIFKVNRGWLVFSFLLFYLIQSWARAEVMEHIIPYQTIFVGSLTSPAFFLFTFFMITDPSTSPNGKWAQIGTGFLIAAFDLYYHTLFSLYTFFFAGLTVATINLFIKAFKNKLRKLDSSKVRKQNSLMRASVVGVFSLFLFATFTQQNRNIIEHPLKFERIPDSIAGFSAVKSDILNKVDPRLQHVGKWLLSVGDAVAIADVDLDGDPDVFLTQSIKSPESRAKLYLNEGDFRFKKLALQAIEPYLTDVKQYGLPSSALFADFDNDGDADLFLGLGFGQSRYFENQLLEKDSLYFTEKKVPFLSRENTICMAADGLDFNNDGKLDLFVTNALQTYLRDYESKVPLNIFDLPKAEYEGDRRMFHFMHESWHNANNGGKNHLLQNDGKGNFEPAAQIDLPQTRWSLALGCTDFNNDGFTDVYIANDFGRDDCYLNIKGQKFIRQEGQFFGEIGLDTYKGMNVSLGDLDNNGKNDLYISNVHHALQAEGSLLWLNYTKDQSNDVILNEEAASRNALNTNRFGWGANISDLDMDGDQDIVQCNGMVGDSWDKIYPERVDYWYYQAQIAKTGPEIHSYADQWADIRGCSIYENEQDRILINGKDGYFTDIAQESGFTHRANTRGVASADFDNDGDPDLLITDQFGAPILYENKVKDKQWLGIQLVGNGQTTNKDAVGTKVKVSYSQGGKEFSQFREVRLQSGFSAQSDKRLLFGFGKQNQSIKNLKVQVHWHGGNPEFYQVDRLNEYHTFRQGEDLEY